MIDKYPPHYHSKCNPDYRNKSAIELNTVSERMAHLKSRLEETMKSLLEKSKDIECPTDFSIIRISENVNMSEAARIVKYTMSLDHGVNKYGDKLRWLKLKIMTITPSKAIKDRLSSFAVVYVLPEKEDTLAAYDGSYHPIHTSNITSDKHWARKVTRQLFDDSNTGKKIETLEKHFKGPGIVAEASFRKKHSNHGSISPAGSSYTDF